MPDITLTVDNVIRVPKPFNEIIRRHFIKELTHDNPQYYMELRAVGGNVKAVRVPKIIKSYYESDTHFIIPRGTGAFARRVLTHFGYKVNVIDNRVSFSNPIKFYAQPGWQLRPHQQIAHEAFKLKEQGVLEAPCGSGKTVHQINEIASKRQPTMIIVHTKDLMKQWIREIGNRFQLDEGQIGTIGEGIFEPNIITIGMVQTLVRLNKDQWRQLQQMFGMVVCDECHHVPAETFLFVMNKFPAKYRFGVSATPERKDKLHFLLHEFIGPVIHRILDSTLEAAGITMSAQVEKVLTNFDYSYSGMKSWVFMINAMAKDEVRNELIRDTVIKDVQKGNFALVLSDRVDHCKSLAARLQEVNIKARYLVGQGLTPEERSHILKECREGKVDVLLATQLADEALDIPNLGSVHLTCPSNNEGKLKQRVGRIRRAVEGKKLPTVYDYVDHLIDKCCDIWRNRKKWYTNWGFQVDQQLQLPLY